MLKVQPCGKAEYIIGSTLAVIVATFVFVSNSADASAPVTRKEPVVALQPANVYHSVIHKTSAPSGLMGDLGDDLSLQGSSMSSSTPINRGSDLHTAAGHHHGHAHGKYYEYREVPKKKTWKFGYKRGNHKHMISRHEHGKAGKHPHFKTKVKWHDKKSKGKGIHLWDYNHHDKKHHYG